MISTAILTFLLSAITGSAATPVAGLGARAITAPTYYLANCYAYPNDAKINANEYGAIGYYAHVQTLPSTPPKISVLHVGDLLDYEDSTWRATDPFKLTVQIHEDSYTALAGAVVGNATAGTGDKYKCYKLTREQVWVPTDLGTNGTCTSDYVCY